MGTSANLHSGQTFAFRVQASRGSYPIYYLKAKRAARRVLVCRAHCRRRGVFCLGLLNVIFLLPKVVVKRTYIFSFPNQFCYRDSLDAMNVLWSEFWSTSSLPFIRFIRVAELVPRESNF